MTVDTTELTRALRDATTELLPRPSFSAAVLRGARRRRSRRRLQIAIAMAAVLAVTGTATYVLASQPRPGPDNAAADPRLTAPTKGDLAGDNGLLATAVEAWRTGVSRSWNAGRGIFDDLRGRPHVYWAGSTPAGPAAVVLQAAFLHPHGNLADTDANQLQTLVGLVAVDPADHNLKLVWDAYHAVGAIDPGQFQFGPGDRTILALGRDSPLFLSTQARIAPEGQVLRDWQRLPVTDGVAVFQVPDGQDPGDVRLVARPVQPAPDDHSYPGMLWLEPASNYLRFAQTQQIGSGTPPDNRLPWTGPAADLMRVGQPVIAPPDGYAGLFDQALTRAGFTDTDAAGEATLSGMWRVLAGLPDGRAALVSEHQQGNKPSRIFAVLFRADGSPDGAVAGGQVDRSAPLPVRVRMPDGQGWVVAAYGATLRYRMGAGDTWHDAGANAALLPVGTTQVQVTRGSTSSSVDLKP